MVNGFSNQIRVLTGIWQLNVPIDMPRKPQPQVVLEPMRTVQALLNHTRLGNTGGFASRLIESYAFPAQASLLKAVELESDELVLRIALHTPADTSNLLRRYRDFNAALDAAISKGRLRLADVLVSTFPQACIRSGALKAISSGNLAFLQRLHREDRHVCWGSRMLSVATRQGSLEVIQWLHSVGIGGFGSELVVYAAARRDPRILHWVLANTAAAVTDNALIEACGAGRVFNVEVLVRRLGRIHPACVIRAALFGKLAVIRWLHINGAVFTEEAMDRAAAGGHCHVVQWLHQNRQEGCTQRAMDDAIMQGHDEMVRWLFENRQEGCSDAAMRLAVTRNALNTVKWLHQHYTMEWRGQLIDDCALHGSLAMLMWLDQHYPATCSNTAISNAIMSGNREMLYWLLSNRSEACTHTAMVYAAARGELDLVEYLHHAGMKGCIRVMDAAAAHGQTEVVRWLHENRYEGCSTRAMDSAASNGHLAIVQYLHYDVGASCTYRAMDWAAANGHLDVVSWLHKNRSEGCTTRAMDAAAENGFFDVVIFLHDNRDEGCTPLASAAAGENDELEMVQWLKAFYPSKVDMNAIRQAARSHAWPAIVVASFE